MTRWKSPNSQLTRNAAATLAAAVAGAASWSASSLRGAVTRSAERTGDDGSGEFRIEVHLMDKIQQKPYLDGSSRENVPSTLRVLAIDLPEMRTDAFSGHCRLAHDKVFVDDIAPPKLVAPVSAAPGDSRTVDDGKASMKTASDRHVDSVDDKASKENGTKPVRRRTIPKQQQQQQQSEKLKIAQKVILKSIVHCRSPNSQQRIGVQLAEASIADLNRYGLRKTHQVGNYKYDPGKYYSSNHKPGRNPTGRRGTHTVQREGDDEELDEADHVGDERSYNTDFNDDEIEAPWNQYAWKEELRLRIHGKIEFDAPVERASTVRRHLLGNVYKHTVPSAQNVWDWFLPKFLQKDPAGLDGNHSRSCWASHKPHAVIANGAALQRVPSALRLVQKYCKDADVPLFVLHDPRVWGGNTHETLPDALRDMRQQVKNRIVRRALKQHGSSAFARGRIVGQLEREAKWIAKDRSQRVRNFFRSRSPTKASVTEQWKDLDAKALEKKFAERGLITYKVTSDGTLVKRYAPGIEALLELYLQERRSMKSTADSAAGSDGDSGTATDHKQADRPKTPTSPTETTAAARKTQIA